VKTGEIERSAIQRLIKLGATRLGKALPRSVRASYKSSHQLPHWRPALPCGLARQKAQMKVVSCKQMQSLPPFWGNNSQHNAWFNFSFMGRPSS
jgi:hypothetical protein